MDDDCEDLKESIRAKIKEMRKIRDKRVSGAAASTSKKTPTSTPSQSRSASPTKSAMRGTNLTPSLTNSAKRKVAFSLSDVSASEDDKGVFALPETPSKKRPRRAPAAAARVMPVSKAAATSSSSEGEGAEEDIEMSDAAVSPAPTPRTRPRRAASASTSGTPPVAGPSTPRRLKATPTHAYRTPPSARIQLRIFDDEDEAEDAATVGDDAEVAEASEDDDDDTLPPSRRFRPVFPDRVQWAQRAPRLARDRAAAERRTRELVGRWGYPFELLRRASAKSPAG